MGGGGGRIIGSGLEGNVEVEVYLLGVVIMKIRMIMGVLLNRMGG